MEGPRLVEDLGPCCEPNEPGKSSTGVTARRSVGYMSKNTFRKQLVVHTILYYTTA